jgi:hypothetical protein
MKMNSMPFIKIVNPIDDNISNDDDDV